MEELLERAPEQRDHHQKMDKAYHLLSMGLNKEADALFDEILEEEPFNRDARTGKNLIARQLHVERRMDHAGARAHKALPEQVVKPAEPEEQPKPERKNPLRSKKVLTALVAAFVMFCGLAAAFIGTNGFAMDAGDPAPTEYAQQK